MSTNEPIACIEFSQNAWRPGLCSNCQRPRTEHASSGVKSTKATSNGAQHRGESPNASNTSSPVPNKRHSTVLRSQTLPRQNRKSSNESQNAAKDSESVNTEQAKTVVKTIAKKCESDKDFPESQAGDVKSAENKSSQRGPNVVKINVGSDKKDSDTKVVTSKDNQRRSILSQKKVKVVIADKANERRSSRVAFIDALPDVIGYDGGVSNLFDDDDDLEQPTSSPSDDTFSLTDEEKHFALLALENTVWNSDAQNLLLGNSTDSKAHRRTSKEYEDLNFDTLRLQRRFQNLKDCDATRLFGTFPLSKRPSSAKVCVESIFPITGSLSVAESDTSGVAGNRGDKSGESESSSSEHSKPAPSRFDQLRSSSLSGDSSRTSLSDGDGKSWSVMTESSTPAYKVVDIVNTSSRDSYTVRDITNCLYEPTDGKGKSDGDSISENSGNSSGRGQPSSSENSSGSPTNVKAKSRARPVGIRVSTVERSSSPRSELTGDGGELDSDPFNDSTTAAGLQVLALLNDVLDNYGENESSTDETEGHRSAADRREQDRGGKKSAAFEARMASVAANLDLSKQQRAKRPAPRPPSSPPPEPTVVSPKKKTANQPEPVFKMVPIGKAIMAIPPSQDVPKSPQATCQGLPSFEDLPESAENGDRGLDGNRAKKGLTSFFRNILRRGRDSSESFESSNPEVQFLRQDSRAENVSSSALSLTETDQSSADKRISEASPQAKFRVLPQGAPPASNLARKKSTGDSESSGESLVASTQPKPSSPSAQHKKVLASPKEMLRRTAAKMSPPTQRKSTSNKEETAAPATKPKPILAPRKSDEKDSSESSTAPNPVRRRAKSPKRIPPPAPPARPTAAKSEASDLTRELEQRLKSAAGGSAPALTSKPAPAPQAKLDMQPYGSKTETRKSMTVPPPSPPNAGKSQTPTHVSRSPPASPTPEESDSQPGSPTTTTPPESRLDETTSLDDGPRFVEKIELPTAAPGKKGFLGKLNMNRKSRAPAAPSVKRARSISDAEKRGKKINPADISGPVLVTDVTNTSMLETRRNTISLGDDPALAAAASNAAAQSIEKGFDDLDMPILSPLGSLENLYEAILPKEGSGGKFPYYDPPETTSRTLCPNIPAEGYLEPVPTTTAATVDQSGEAFLSATTLGEGDLGVKREVEGESGSSGADSGDVFVDALLPPALVELKMTKVKGRSQEKFVEPELTEERQRILASQPIYEEIPSCGQDWYGRSFGRGDADTKSLASQVTQMTDISQGDAQADGKLPSPNRTPNRTLESSSSLHVHSATLPHRRKTSADTTQQQSAPRKTRSGSMSQADAPVSAQQQALASVSSPMTSSMISALPVTTGGNVSPSPFMTASMTASLMWQSPHSQPVDSNGELLPLPPIPNMAPRSVSKETVSSESDSSGTLSRPRPVPRRRPKRPDTAGSDQYVSMNRPNAQVTLGETKLRETFARLTNMNFQTLHDVYVQCEKMLALEKIALPTTTQLKWADFDIYGQALHSSGRCVVYNAKLRTNNASCQIMVLHSRPAAEMSLSTHPSLLRPAAIFADNVPFSFLTADFIKTSQLLQNSVYDSCLARCFLAVGVFDVAESLSAHLSLLRETLTHDPSGYLRVLLMVTLQLLSAMSHCLDRGFTVTETDLGDVFLIARHDLRGKVVAFLPHQRAPDVPQGEAMCGFLDKLLQEASKDYCLPCEEDDTNDNEEEANLVATVEKLRLLLEPRRIECLAHVRSIVEYLLFGPNNGMGLGAAPAAGTEASQSLDGTSGETDASSVEQDHSAWLERERASMVGKFARSVEGLGNGAALEDFYRLKFLLKSSATSLSECCRRLA